MSRIGIKPITIPDGVTVDVTGNVVKVKGSKGEISMELHNAVSASVADGAITVKNNNNSKTSRAMWGTTKRLIENMVHGVSQGFEKKLELNGVGYRMALKGKQIDLALGFSHPVLVDIPEGLTVEIDKMLLTVTGVDKQAVGQFAAEIRALKPVEPYKGKGFKYSDEIVRRKEGKKAAAA